MVVHLNLIFSLPRRPTAPMSVTKAGTNDTGFVITITFDPSRNPIGRLQPLSIDPSHLSGSQIKATVSKSRDGSTNLFYIIPTELTQVGSFIACGRSVLKVISRPQPYQEETWRGL